MLAPPPMRLAAHDFAFAGLLFCVSQVRITSLRPSTPPFALSWLTRTLAAASAGLSNGAMLPLLSNAQPITIGLELAADADAAVAATIAASAARSATSAPVLLYLITPPGLDGWTVGARTPPLL